MVQKLANEFLREALLLVNWLGKANVLEQHCSGVATARTHHETPVREKRRKCASRDSTKCSTNGRRLDKDEIDRKRLRK